MSELIGKTAVVTGTINGKHLGEVAVPVRAGVEHFAAYAENREDVLPEGTKVVIVDDFHNRTLVVRAV